MGNESSTIMKIASYLTILSNIEWDTSNLIFALKVDGCSANTKYLLSKVYLLSNNFSLFVLQLSGSNNTKESIFVVSDVLVFLGH